MTEQPPGFRKLTGPLTPLGSEAGESLTQIENESVSVEPPVSVDFAPSALNNTPAPVEAEKDFVPRGFSDDAPVPEAQPAVSENLSENQKRAQRGEAFQADWVSPTGEAPVPFTNLTPAELRKKLGSMISEFGTLGKKGIEHAKAKLAPKEEAAPTKPEGTEAKRAEMMSDFLISRQNQIGKDAESSLGEKGLELVKKAGAWYRKQPLKRKIAISIALGGLSVASGGSGAWFFVVSGAMMGQRALGAASTYVAVEGLLAMRNKKEATRLNSKYGRNAIALTAALFVGSGTAGSILKGIANESGATEAVHGWLSTHWPGTHAPEVPTVSKSIPIAPEAIAPPSIPDIQVPEASQLHVEVQKGEGAYQFWTDFREKLVQQGYSADAKSTPAAIRHILESNPYTLTKEFGFAGDTTSGVMHAGDSLSINEHGAVVFIPASGDAVTLGESLPDGTFRRSDLFHGDLHTNVPVSAESSGTEAAPSGEHAQTPNDIEHQETEAPNAQQHTQSGVVDTAVPSTNTPEPVGKTLDALNQQSTTPETAPSADTPPLVDGQGAPASQDPVLMTREDALRAAGETPVTATPFGELNTFMQSSDWSAYHDFNSQSILVSDPTQSNMPLPAQELRKDLFNVIRESGIGPARNETVEAFISRATDHVLNPDVTVSHPQVMETADHVFVVRGGDLSARSFLANEYALRVNANAAHVYVEGPQEGTGEYLDYNAKTLAGTQLKPIKIAPQLAGAKVVF